MSDGSAFFDTNVLVYLFDRSAGAKQKRARALLAELAPTIVISTQVLQEFYVTTTAKLAPPLSPEDAESQVRNFSAFDVVSIDVALVRSAISLSREHKLSLWDALIVESAHARGCTRLLTEDLQHGREFGRLRVENPFRTT
jgi:predicted nucleic acid-binding protein